MGAVMLLFLLAVSGESGLLVGRYASMAVCEAAREAVIVATKDIKTRDGAPIEYIAAVCVIPAKVEAI